LAPSATCAAYSGDKRKAVRGEERCKVPLVDDTDRHLGIELAHASNLSVFPGDQPLVRRRQLDEHTACRQIEVGAEPRHRRAVRVPFEWELHWLVLPALAIQVE